MKYLKRFNESNNSINIEYYEHGKCELFAFALHIVLGYDMYFFIDNEAEFETDGDFDYGSALVHAYCKNKNGNYFDASGLITLNDIEEDHAEYVNGPEHILVSDEMFYDYIKDGFISDFIESELENIEKYIKDNILNYG
jgi:hypothetical protein